MPRLALLAAALLAALVSAAPASALPETVPGEVLVRFKGNAGGSERAQARRSAKVEVERDMRLPGAQVLRTEPGQTVEQAIAALERHGAVLYAEPNHIFRATATTPDDPHFGSLWGLHNTALDADIDAPEAWDVFKEAPGVKVAVVDSGVRWDHPDLDGNVFSNAADPLGGGDDDGNGFVDDVRGWDFHDDDNDPTDVNDHGTHVAGTIAAEGNNAAGVTGVAWDAQIIPVRVLGAGGWGTGDDILDGFDYAADMGAKVVNASLGGEGNDSLYADVLAQHPDTLFVVAAGNQGSDNEAEPQQPCNAPAANLICVAATNSQDALASFSNFGSAAVDLGAPGVGTYSTLPEFADPVFSDGFEVSLANWTTVGSTGGTWSQSTLGSRKVARATPTTATGYRFSSNENLILRTAQPVNLTGKSRCVVQFDLRYGYSYLKDALMVETSTNGVNWILRDVFSGENGFMEELRIDPKADGAATLHVRFRVDADSQGETVNGQPKEWFGAALDDVLVKCEAPTQSSYGLMTGTSMATPHVAGVATLLFGARPDADVAQVRNWLLSTGDPLAVLSGKTVTGRRLNANAALLAATGALPGPEVITDAAAALTETGATLAGRVDPNGTETAYQFRYGTAPGSLDSTVPAAPVVVGSGSELVGVTQPITGLTPGATYYFKLVAIQNGTATEGVVQSFKTPAKLAPTLTNDDATEIQFTSATLGGTVNPNGKATTVLFEWGTESGKYAWQTETLVVDAHSAPLELVGRIGGLSPGTTYYYRLRGSNADGEGVSPERSFTTLGTAASPLPIPGVSTSGTPLPGTNGTPPQPLVSVKCRRTKRGKVACRAGSSSALKVTVRVFKRSRTYARGKASSLTRGKAIRMKTVRRVRRGRYKLQLKLIRSGAIVATITKTIKL